MIAEAYNPLERYRSEFQSTFAENAERFFEELVTRSGVNEEENAGLVSKYNLLCRQAKEADSRCGAFAFGIGVDILLMLGSAAVAIIGCFQKQLDVAMDENVRMLCILIGFPLALLCLTLFLKWLKPGYSKAKSLRDKLKKDAEAVKQEALEQMAPLNALYTWDIPARLFEQTVPNVKFDRFSNEARIQQFADEFGWDGDLGIDTSVLFAQSGELADNPFAFVHFLKMVWGEKTYTGRLTIHWTTWERDSDGKRRQVHHSETLTASVTKPAPEYHESSAFVYGNEAAPNLSFTRKCTGLGQADGFFGSMRKRQERKKLEKFSRNLEDESQYTMMANKEFETLFNTMDRDNEVEFRLLFTPMAQKQMVELLKENKFGYGDDFQFSKDHKINILHSYHLSNTDLDTRPLRFANFDLRDARRVFLEWNQEYFRSLYFSMAPVLAIPLYMQTLPQSKLDIYPELSLRRANFWEFEAMANYLGRDRFKHPQSVTQQILKAHCTGRSEGGTASVDVTAYGYRTVEHTDYISKYGGDGQFHDVPVHWLEFLPVERTSQLNVKEMPGWSLPEYNAECVRQNIPRADAFRREIIAFFQNNNREE